MAWRSKAPGQDRVGAQPAALLDDLPRGDPDRNPLDTDMADFRGPHAQFATAHAIRSSHDLAYASGKLFLGVVEGQMESPDHARERHVLGGHPVGLGDDRHIVTIAGSRAGKGRSVIIPNMLLYPGSVLATDPKGELASLTALQRRDGLGQQVHVLDPFGTVTGPAAELRKSFNPVAALGAGFPEDASSDRKRDAALIEGAALIADALVVPSERDAHWDESARSFIEGVILHVRTAAAYRSDKRLQSLVTVQRLIAEGMYYEDEEGNAGTSMEALEVAMRSNPSVGGLVQTAAADFFERPERERDSVLSTARRHLKFLTYPEIQGVVEGHDFELETLKTARTTIYLCLPARHIGTCARWLRLFINLTLQAMEKVRGHPAGGVPVLLALDEFATLGHMRQIEDAAGQIAGFGVKLWPILQDLGQLKALYSDRWETFLGNAGVLQFFGNNDLTTLEWISKRCGRTSIEARRLNALTPMQEQAGAKGESRSIEVHDLLTPDEVGRFFNRDDHKHRQLVLWASGTRPLILQRVFYDKHALFAGLSEDLPS